MSMKPSTHVDGPSVIEGIREFLEKRDIDLNKGYTREAGDVLFIDGGGGGKEHLLHPKNLVPKSAPVAEVSGLMSLKDLRKEELMPPEYVVQNIISAGETTLIVGRPKIGKSRLVQQLALSVTRGESFLGFEVPRPLGVLLVDLENRASGLRGRLVRMSPREEHGDQRLQCYVPSSLAEDRVNTTPKGITELSKMLKQTHSDLLIIDTWRLFVGGDENNPDVIVKALKAISGLRKNNPKLAIVIVHHLRKERGEAPVLLSQSPYQWTENVSGHHALVGHVDAVWGLDRERGKDGEERLVFGGVARNSETRTVLLEDEGETLRFSVSSDSTQFRSLLTPAEEKIWDQLVPLRQFTFNRAAKTLQLKNKKALSRCLSKARDHGLVDRSNGVYQIVKE